MGRIFQSQNWANVPEVLRTFSLQTPADVAATVALTGLYGYMGVAGLYAIATMNPAVANYLGNKLPEHVDRWLFPGAYLGTSAAMIASGFDPIPALAFTMICYAVQYRHHVQGGGDWRVWKPDVFKDLDLSKYMRAGAIQLLYIGPGNAIKPHIDKIDWAAANASQIGDYLMANVQAHLGLVPFLAALGVFHAAFTGLNIKQTLKAKYSKAYTYEIPANVLKLILGWTSLSGNVVATMIKEFGIGSIVTTTYREAGDSPVQRDVFRGLLRKISTSSAPVVEERSAGLDGEKLELYKQMASEAFEIERRGINAARAGDGVRFANDNYANLSVQDKLIRLTSNYYVRNERSLLVDSRPQFDDYNDVVFRALTTTDTPDEVVDGYLRRLGVVLSDLDPQLADVRHNLLLATMRAAASAAHGERVRAFLDLPETQVFIDGHNLRSPYNAMVSKNETDGRDAWKAWKMFPWSARRFIAKHARKPIVTQDDRFYNAVATAGRRFPFSGVITGNSLVQNGAAFSSFLLSAAQGNPAFETIADPTLYRGTLYKFLMTSAATAKTTTDKYVASVVSPMLTAISRLAARLEDERPDVRHNLLITVWLASRGPYGALIRKWITENKHLYNAHGIYGAPRLEGRTVDMPGSLAEKRRIKALFAEYLVDSTNSADGVVRYNLPDRAEMMRWPSAQPRAAGRVFSTPGADEELPL